jgi:hypothetical protein
MKTTNKRNRRWLSYGYKNKEKAGGEENETDEKTITGNVLGVSAAFLAD